MMTLPFNCRLGAIGFINTIPVYLPFGQPEGVELVYEVPSALNRMMGEGKLDISPVSSAYYLRNKDKLVLLEDLSVSSPGAVESVIFVSRYPLTETLLDLPAIAVPDDSETSVALLAWLLKVKTGQDVQPKFQVYPAADYRKALAEVGCALVIGDNALLIHEQGVPDGYYCYDLSSLWSDLTELPFVFAVWVAGKAWAQAHPETLVQINRMLVEGRNRFFEESSEWLEMGIQAARSRCTISEARIHRYFTRALDYRLGPTHQQALLRFDMILQPEKKADEPILSP